MTNSYGQGPQGSGTLPFCRACGQPGTGSRFCTSCGASLAVEQPGPSAAVEQTMVRGALPPVPPAPARPAFPPPPAPQAFPTPAPYSAPGLSSQRPPKKKGSGGAGLPWLVGLLALAVLSLAATGIWLRMRDDDSPRASDDPATSGGSSEPGTTDSSNDSVSDDDDADPLGLGRDMVNQDCTGEYVVMLASSGDPSAYFSTLAPALDMVDDASYLVTDESCGSFNQSIDGERIYAAYEGPYDSRAAACAARTASSFRGAYVRLLDAAVTERGVCACETSAGEPTLSRNDPEGEVARAYAVTDVQVLLGRADERWSGSIDGVFSDTLDELVRAFQEEHHLDADGVVGEDTWIALRGYC